MVSPDSAPLLKFLGGAVIQVGDTPLGGPAAHRHRLALLALLTQNVRPVSRDKLLALLWPERDAEHGRNLLKVAVHELRKLLGDGVIRTTGDQLSLDPSLVRCDATEFEAAIATGENERALELYRGPFLDGFFLKDAGEFERWAESERARLAAVYIRALKQLATTADERGDAAIAVRWWRLLADHDPVRGEVALGLMHALAASGDWTGAVRHADLHAERIRDELGAEPDPAISALAKQLRDGSPVAEHGRATPFRLSSVSASPPIKAGATRISASTMPKDAIAESRPAAPAGRRFPVRLPLVAGLAVIGTALLIALGIRQRANAGPAVAPNLIAVLPYRVVGSDTSLAFLREGMMDMLATRLAGDGGQRVVDSRAALAAWRSAASPTGEISLSSALGVARGLGAGELLLGDAIGGSRGIELSGTVYRVPGGEVIARARRVIESTDKLAPQVDRLAAELMSRAGGEPEDRLGDLTRRSLPSLRAYLGAEDAYRQGRYARAESLYAKALDIDPAFPLAGMGLALANSWTGINEHYGVGRDAALRGQASLSARDRMFVSAFFGPDPSIGQPHPAPAYLAAWEDVVHHWPDWAEAWYNLGDRYYHFGGLSGLADPLDHARAAFTRSLELDTAFTAPLHHLVEIYARQGDTRNLRVTGERYFEHNPTVARDASAIGWSIATATGDEKWLARIRARFDSMPASDLARIVWITEANGWSPDDASRALDALDKQAGATYERENALTLRYAFSLNAGHPAQARAAAAAYEALMPDQPIASLLELYAALFSDGDTVVAKAAAQRLEPFAASAPSGNADRRARQFQARCLTGYWKFRHGDMTGARADLHQVEKRVAGLPIADGPAREGRMCAAWLQASMAVATHDPAASNLVSQLDTIVLRDRVPPRIPLSAGAIMSTRLHEELGQLDLALASSRWREHYTGAPIFLSTQLESEGELALRAGDMEGAVRAFRHTLALRPKPESGLAAAATAAVRARLDSLGKR